MKLPFSTTRVSGAPLLKPRSSSVVRNVSSRDSPGCSGVASV